MARVMSEEHVRRQNAIARVIKERLVDQSLGRFADVAVILGEHRFYEQSDRGKRRKCGMVARAASISPNKVAELLRFLMRRSGGEQINKDCLELMNERQSDIYYVTGFTTIPPTCPEDPLIDQPSMVALRKNGLVVTYTVHPPSGWAVQLLHEVPATLGRNAWADPICFTCDLHRQSRLGGLLLNEGADLEGADLERPEEAPDLQKWTRVKPKNQTAQDQAAKKLKKQRLAPKDDSDTSNSERCSTTGTGSSTTATGTTGQAAATKLHKA